MSDSFVQVQPDSSGKKIDTQTLDNGNYRQSVTVGDGFANGSVATVFPDGSLNTTSIATQLFQDTFDVSLDTTNKWNAPISTGNAAVTVLAGAMTVTSGTTLNNYSLVQSQPNFSMNEPSYIFVNHRINIEYPVSGNGYRFWGLGLAPAIPTLSAPIYNGYGFEIGVDGKLYAVTYANGNRNLIQDLSGTGNNTQPLDANSHKYYMQISGGVSYWFIDSLENVVATMTTGAQGSIVNTLPILYLAVSSGSSPAVSITVDGIVIGDSGRNNVQISDGTYSWRQAYVNSSGALGVKEIESLSVATGNVTANAGSWTASTQYYVGNVVTSLGSLYTCTTGGISGNVAISTNQFSPVSKIVDNTVNWDMTYVVPSTDTSNYKSISVQLNPGTGNGGTGVRVLQSNDNANWFITPGFSPHLEPAPIDELTTPGLMTVPVYGRYYCIVPVEYSIGSYLSVYSYLRDVDANGLGANLMSRAMDQTDPTPLQVQDIVSLRDQRGAAIPSDAPKVIYYGLSSLTQIVIIDTQGYNSTSVTTFGTFTATATFYTSNDQTSWSILQGYISSTSGPSSTVAAANTMTIFPNYGRYIKIQLTAYTSGNMQFAVNLRQSMAPFIQTTQAVNTSQIGATAVVTAGIAGIQAIGGNVANGVAATANPVLVAGVDSSALTRRLLTDPSGRLMTSAFDQAAIVRALTMLSPGATMNNVAAQPTMDQTNFEGQSLADLFAQILLELRIMNQQMYELPKMLNTGIVNTADEPQLLRNDPTLFQQ